MGVGPSTDEDAPIVAAYQNVIAGWNARDGDAYTVPFAEDADVVGFDGSQLHGRGTIREEMSRIFADHETATYVTVVRGVRRLSADVAVLSAVAGMVPPGGSDVMPERHAVQTAIVARRDGEWRVVLFQNTPARFDGRPELVESLTAELRRALT